MGKRRHKDDTSITRTTPRGLVIGLKPADLGERAIAGFCFSANAMCLDNPRQEVHAGFHDGQFPLQPLFAGQL